jgi:oxalate decarboxylase/phosphoglucose isomerase-like protein (cupin superfamily)
LTEGGLVKFFIKANEDKWRYNLKGKAEIMLGQESDSIIVVKKVGPLTIR